MLRWLLVVCLLSAAHTRVILGPRELELGWPFDDPNTTHSNHRASAFAPYLRTLPDQCMLWDSSCSGNETEALDEFFNNKGTMRTLVYDAWEYYAVTRKISGIPPENNSKIVSWMRDPDCRSSFLEWHTEHPDQSTWTYTDRTENKDVISTMDWSSVASASGNVGCCDACELVGGNVDVYYWPVPGANTDCLASVGTTAASDIDQNLILPDARGVGGGWWNSLPNPYTVISSSSPSNPAPQNTLNARGHAILSAPENHSGPRNVATQNGFTFTSPSIYVGFSALWAADRCGPIGTYISYTMLAFTPGELSTIEMPVWDRGDIPPGATKSFNFADLPCPPSSVMIADQYKPAPGSPYRPVLSPPQQIYNLQLGWSDCTITHAFAGIDPPKSLVPAAALVPNITPTSPQSHVIETTSISSLEPVSEASGAGATRDPPAAPAHKVQTPGPRSTPSPSSPFTAENGPLKPENSLESQHSQAVETDPRVSKWQAPISPEAESTIHTSSKKVKDSSIQGPSKDRSFTSLANTEVSKILSNVFQFSRVSSDQRSDTRSTSSPNAVVSDSLLTQGEIYEEGASISLTGKTRNPSSDDDPGQDPSHSSWPQENKYTQGTTIAEPDSPRLEPLSDSDISTRNRNPPDQPKGNPNGPFTQFIADPSAKPASGSNPARNPDVGSSIGSLTPATLHSLPYDPSLNEQGEQQSQTSSPSNADGGLTSINLSASNPSHEVKPDPLTSAPSTGSTIIPRTKSDLLTSASPITFKGPSESNIDPLIYSPASIGIYPTNSISRPSTDDASTPTNTTVSQNFPNKTANPLSRPSSDLHSEPAGSNTLGRPSNSTTAVSGNQTAPAFEPSAASTVNGRAGVSSSTSESLHGTTTVVPLKNREERNAISYSTGLLLCFGSMFLLYLV